MINLTDASGKFRTPTEFSIQAEPEMSSHSGLYQFADIHIAHRELLESVMTQAFLAQPIIGNISITGEQHERIHMLAED